MRTGLHQRLLVVEDRFVVQADELAGFANRRVDLDRLHLARELELRVRLPALDVARPRDQHVFVPEADRLAIPTRHRGAEARHAAFRHVFHVELAADVGVLNEVARHARAHVHEIRRGDHVVLPHGGRIPAPHEAFRPAERRGPQRVAAHLVIRLLHHPLLVLRRQHREHRRDLGVPTPVPVALIHGAGPLPPGRWYTPFHSAFGKFS